MNETEKSLQAEIEKLVRRLDNMMMHQKRLEAATLTVALLDKRRKALTIAEVPAIARDIEFARYPLPNNPEYQEWAKTKDETLNYVHK